MALPEIKLDFGDSFENALARRASADWYGQRARSEAAEDQRKAESQQYVEPAMRGDSAAMGKLAFGNPAAASAMATNFARMDTAQRAQTKARAEFAASSANAILQADPADRAAIFKFQREEGMRRGYDMSHLPAEWNPSLEPYMRSTRQAALPYTTQYTQDRIDRRDDLNRQQRRELHNTPSGGSGQVIDMDGGGTTSGQPQGDVVPYGPAGALPAGNQGRAGNAIAGMETGGQPGGGYGAIGPVADSKGSRAYGKYQVMDFNIGPWTAEILGRQMTPQQFLASPEAQEAVFAGKFGQYVQKYGSQQAAARAWFAGEGGMNNPNARDVNGMTVARYEQGFNRGLGGDGGGSAGGAGVPPTGVVPGGIAQVPPDQIPPPAPAPVQPPTDYGPGYGQEVGNWDPARGIGAPWRPGGGSGGDGGGTPLPPQGGDPAQPQGQLPLPASRFLDQDPSRYGLKPVGILKNGVKSQKEEGGHFVYFDPRTGDVHTGTRYYYDPKGDTDRAKGLAEAKRKAENPDHVPGPFPATSVQGNALNILIQDKVLTRNQAAQVSLGRVVTGADGAQYYISGDQIIGAAGGARPGQVTPQPTGAPVVGADGTTAATPAPQPQATGPVQLTQPKPQTLNSEQARDSTFADRMVQAEQILSSVAEQGMSSGGRTKEAMPFGMGNYAQTSQYQQFKQARDNFINAQLRRESGAVISDAEYANADKQYFPVPGDKPEVLAQKAENRRTAVAGMARGAGPTYKPPAASGPVKVATPEEAMKLPPGTRFVTPDGREKVRP